MGDDDGYGPYQRPSTDYTDSTQGAESYGGGSKAKPSKSASNKPPNGELTILTRFVWSPEIDSATELAYLTNGTWYPGWADYVEIAGPAQVSPPADFTALLGTIQQFDPGSIQRLNFFTHANKKVIGIQGTIDKTDVWFTNFVDETELAKHVDNDFTYSFNKGTAQFTLADVRKRFTSDAIFVVYGCDAAFDPTRLLTGLRNVLEVSVIGFKDKTVFCPPPQKGTGFDRRGEKIGVFQKDFQCGRDSTSDWRSLINHVSAVRVDK
jgi:hypothetical protein